MGGRVLTIAVGCDCDPDRPSYRGTGGDLRRGRLVWNGVTRGIPALRDMLKTEGLGKLKITWNVRADTQLRDIYGNAGWALGEFGCLWNNLEAAGDEIAWHPHFWRWNQAARAWFQETEDYDWMKSCLAEGIAAFHDMRKRIPSAVHMGWLFHNNLTLAIMANAGILVDYSAVPGIRIEGGDNKVRGGECDWAITTIYPYYPSKSDYRRPATPGEGSLDILEIPVPGCSSPLLKGLKAIKQLVKGEPVRPILQGNLFFPIAAHWAVVSSSIKDLLAKSAEVYKLSHLVVYFHADELVGRQVYSSNNLVRNLNYMARIALEHGYEVEFSTVSELARNVLGR